MVDGDYTMENVILGLGLFSIIPYMTASFIKIKIEPLMKGGMTFIWSILLMVLFVISEYQLHFLLMSLAFLLASVGDYVLASIKFEIDEEKKSSSFMIGLGTFFLAYLLVGIVNLIFLGLMPVSYLIMAIMALASFNAFMILDKDKLQGMVIPIILYFMQATLLVSSGIGIFADGYTIYAILFNVGLLSFYISDLFIAINMFRNPLKLAEPLVMSTYGFALFTIVFGLFGFYHSI